MKIQVRTSAFTLLVTAIWMLSFYGIESIPLEKHEVFVLETSQTMLETGDWVVPRFNGELRLQKPPMNYWATCALVMLDPFNDSVRIWHGRLVSLLAGLGIVLMSAAIGRRLVGGPAGILTATLLLCMQGFLHLSYNARPDPLYGFFSLLHLFCWIEAWRARDGQRTQRTAAACGWAAAGLAVLTKGPQVPAVFALGLLLFLLHNRERKRILSILRPLTGLPLALLITLPWPILLHHRLQSNGVNLADTQLSGSLLTQFASWSDLLSFYYPVRLLPLLLPALLLLPLPAYRLFKYREPLRPPSRLLLICLFTLLLVFSLGGQYRKHYLYPALPLIALLSAGGFLRQPLKPLTKPWRLFLTTGCAAAMLAYAVLLARHNPLHAALLLSLCVLGAATLGRSVLQASVWPAFPLCRQLTGYSLIMATALSGLYSTLPHRADRRANQNLTRRIADTLPPHTPVLSFSADDFTLPFYLHRRVEERELPQDRAAFTALLAQHPGPVIVMPQNALGTLNPALPFKILDRSVIPEDPEQELVAIQPLLPSET